MVNIATLRTETRDIVQTMVLKKYEELMEEVEEESEEPAVEAVI